MLQNLHKSGLLIVCVVLALSLTSCKNKEESTAPKSLNFYNWSEYIDPAVITEFEAESGIKVQYDLFDSQEVVESKMLAGDSGYDLVVIGSNFMERFISNKLAYKLDKSLLPNLVNADPNFLKVLASFDANNEHAINYLWGMTAISYNEELVKKNLPNANLSSWSLLFDPTSAKALSKCGIAITDNPAEVVANALIYLKKDPLSGSIEDLGEAKKLLLAIRPYVKYIDTTKVINDFANKEICIGITYNGDANIAQTRADEAKLPIKIKFFVPKEGAVRFFDTLMIPSDAKNIAEAHTFINFILKPEIMAKITNFTQYANSNIQSSQFVDKAVLENTSIYPPKDLESKLISVRSYSLEYERALTDVWNSFRTAQAK
ncbi:MAG: extracellular solute-binding protein [Methylacidiphilales bacterium]|nr:extracellular solute-binding protein [Candidatus Methylacidiphilales bacterium]